MAAEERNVNPSRSGKERAQSCEVVQTSDAFSKRKRRREALGEDIFVDEHYLRDDWEHTRGSDLQLVHEVADLKRIVLEQSYQIGRNSIQISDLQTQIRQPGQETFAIGSVGVLADQWLCRIDTLHITLRAKKESCYDRVKIAILDTGLSQLHVHAHNIEAYRDFVAGCNDMYDQTGHGSIGVDLIFKLLPTSRVFVARVFEDSEAKPNTQDLIAKAIKHARKHWKVNIIVLASGFENDHDGMRDEIMNARAKRVLVFAPASNFGNATHITFPARMHGDVMCMFTSDGNVKPSAVKLNPSPSTISRYNFAILGEGVLSSPSSHRVSGTSISSFIGAAIAGLVIDFSRQDDCRSRIYNHKNLLTINGMSAIFAAMAAKGNDRGYHCVAPWEVMGCSNTAIHQWSRDRKREWICDTISRVLEKMEKG